MRRITPVLAILGVAALASVAHAQPGATWAAPAAEVLRPGTSFPDAPPPHSAVKIAEEYDRFRDTVLVMVTATLGAPPKRGGGLKGFLDRALKVNEGTLTLRTAIWGMPPKIPPRSIELVLARPSTTEEVGSPEAEERTERLTGEWLLDDTLRLRTPAEVRVTAKPLAGGTHATVTTQYRSLVRSADLLRIAAARSVAVRFGNFELDGDSVAMTAFRLLGSRMRPDSTQWAKYAAAEEAKASRESASLDRETSAGGGSVGTPARPSTEADASGPGGRSGSGAPQGADGESDASGRPSQTTAGARSLLRSIQAAWADAETLGERGYFRFENGGVGAFFPYNQQVRTTPVRYAVDASVSPARLLLYGGETARTPFAVGTIRLVGDQLHLTFPRTGANAKASFYPDETMILRRVSVDAALQIEQRRNTLAARLMQFRMF